MDRNQPTEMIPTPALSEFEVVLRGYDRAQVRETIERLDADIRIALTDRDAAVARASDLASQLSAVHAEMESLRRKLDTAAAPTYETMGARIANMLQLAEEEAAEIRRTAHTDTATLREEVQTIREQTEAAQHSSADEVERVRAQADSDASDVLMQATAKAAALVTEAEAQRDQVARQSSERNKRADADFEISLRERRREAARTEAERLRVSTDEANRRVAEATAEATRRVSEATAEAQSRLAAGQAQSAEMISQASRERDRIEGLRQQALHQLLEVRKLLGGLPPETDPTAQPQPAARTEPQTRQPGTEPSPGVDSGPKATGDGTKQDAAVPPNRG